MNQNIKSKELLVHFAKTAASSFTQNKVPLSASITKLAREEGLVPDQVRFLTEETNKQAWSQLFKLNKEAAYDFPLADASKILTDLRETEKPKVVKEYDLDYFGAPILKVASKPMEKVAATAEPRPKKEVSRDLQQKLEKLAYARNEYYMRYLEAGTAAEAEAERLVKDLKNELSSLSYSQRPDAFLKFAKAAYQNQPSTDTIGELRKIAHVLNRLGVMEKVAALEAPEQFISENLPGTVVNGNNVLLIRVKTLNQYNEAAKDSHSRMSLVDDTIPKVKEAIREL